MGSGSSAGMIVYILAIVAVFYFIGIRPQKKEQKKKEEMLKSMAIGDYCVTTSGMYGQIIDITNEMVIIEFGNKNCRIPMVKAAIASVEKDNALQTGISKEGKESADAPEVKAD